MWPREHRRAGARPSGLRAPDGWAEYCIACDCRAAAMSWWDAVESPDRCASLSDTTMEVAMHGAPS